MFVLQHGKLQLSKGESGTNNFSNVSQTTEVYRGALRASEQLVTQLTPEQAQADVARGVAVWASELVHGPEHALIDWSGYYERFPHLKPAK